MKRLGEILLEKGAIGVPELHTGLEACHRSGGRLGTQLLAFGFVDEQTLLEALSEQYAVPWVHESTLRRTTLTTRRLIPPPVARQLRAVPFDRAHGRLLVAMANPRDPAAVEEIQGYTELEIEPHVATEVAIDGVLRELDEDLVEVVDEAAAPEATAPDGPDNAAWERLWRPQRLDPLRLLSLATLQTAGTAAASTAAFPSLAPLDAADAALHLDISIDAASFRRQLQDVQHRDEVGELVQRFALGYLGRVCLFMVFRGRVVGWMARGQSVVVDDVQSFETTVEAPSVFATVRSAGDHYLGPLTNAAADRMLARLLGDPPPRDVVVVPIRVKNRVVAFLLGDLPGESAIAVPVSELQFAAGAAGLAFEVLVLRKKIAG